MQHVFTSPLLNDFFIFSFFNNNWLITYFALRSRLGRAVHAVQQGYHAGTWLQRIYINLNYILLHSDSTLAL